MSIGKAPDKYFGVGVGTSPYSDDAPPPSFPRWSAYEKLAMRLNVPEGEDIRPTVAILPGITKMFIFVLKGDSALILEDAMDMYPSDRLVAEFRLFQQAVQE
jgi:hypothetical protein